MKLNRKPKAGTLSAMELLTTDPNNIFYRCVEDSYESIMITDLKGVLVYVNATWQKIYGYSLEEAIGQTPRILRSGHQDDGIYQSMWKQILDPKIGYWRGELVNRNKAGKEVPVLLTITPFKQSGEIRGYMGIALDMTEKKAMEAKILRQDRLASIGLLASGIAHEIGTPLGIIRGRAELMKAQNKTNEGISSSVDTVVSQIDRLTSLIKNLLNLSRGQNQPGDYAVIKTVIDEVASLLSQKFRQYNIDLVNEVPPEVQTRVGHNKLEQVYLNLLVNGIHAIGVEVKKGNTKNHKIILRYKDLGNKLQLSIQDTGCGIERNNLTHIFQPFFTTKDIGEGTGLGLSISYQIISEAGGDMMVESSPGHGTSFHIELPKK